MKFTFYCAMCGREAERRLDLDNTDPCVTIKGLIEAYGWIVQMNYPHLDIYCSRKCAA